MARPSKKSKSKAAEPADTGPADVVDTALDLFAERGLAVVTLADIAAASGRPLSEVLTEYPGKGAILAAWFGRIDTAMISGGDAAPDDSPRDRLFEVVMRRFDLLAPRKALVGDVVRAATADPLGLGMVLAASLRRSIRWMLAAAGSEAEGLRGVMIRKGLAAVYADSLRIWLKDDTEDASRTMAHLDKRLRQAGDLLNRLTFVRRRGAAPST